MSTRAGIDPTVAPSGVSCAECVTGLGAGWWLHLRRCAQCGHVGCCDTSPSRHASEHWAATGHPVIQSFEPGEDWFWSWEEEAFALGPELAGPTSHPPEQPVPGPAGRVPPDWMELLNA